MALGAVTTARAQAGVVAKAVCHHIAKAGGDISNRHCKTQPQADLDPEGQLHAGPMAHWVELAARPEPAAAAAAASEPAMPLCLPPAR